MEDILPIKISVSKVLQKRYQKLKSVVNKQEAHINFQSLVAGWYEDESNILNINILIQRNDEYQQQVLMKNIGNKEEISDDVTLYSHHEVDTCFIAITETEILLLDKKPKVLSGYITMKIIKVINGIAKIKGLHTL